jgi:hypothetical protein
LRGAPYGMPACSFPYKRVALIVTLASLRETFTALDLGMEQGRSRARGHGPTADGQGKTGDVSYCLDPGKGPEAAVEVLSVARRLSSLAVAMASMHGDRDPCKGGGMRISLPMTHEWWA